MKSGTGTPKNGRANGFCPRYIKGIHRFSRAIRPARSRRQMAAKRCTLCTENQRIRPLEPRQLRRRSGSLQRARGGKAGSRRLPRSPERKPAPRLHAAAARETRLYPLVRSSPFTLTRRPPLSSRAKRGISLFLNRIPRLRLGMTKKKIRINPNDERSKIATTLRFPLAFRGETG